MLPRPASIIAAAMNAKTPRTPRSEKKAQRSGLSTSLFRSSYLGVLGVLAFTCLVQAGDDLPFPKDTWTVEASGGYVGPIRFSDAGFTTASVGANYYFGDGVALGAALDGYAVQQFGEDSAGGGLSLGSRWHALRFQRVTLFGDAIGGVNEFTVRTPPFGTHFNYTAKVGVGLTVRLTDRFHLIGGARYFHLSNGTLHGRDENPSYDGVQGYGGALWTF